MHELTCVHICSRPPGPEDVQKATPRGVCIDTKDFQPLND